MSDKIFIGSDVADLDIGQEKNITKVILSRSTDTWFEAGDDSGDTLEVTNPWATQAMADAILAEVKGAVYLPYTATDALLDPAAEIGDGVTIGGVHSEIVSMDLDLGVAGCVGLSAPGVDEIEDEYPYKSSGDREADRENKRIYSLITKTDEEIRLLVEDEINKLSSSFSVQLESITARVDGLDGEFTELKVTVDGVTVTDSTGTTKIKGSSIETDTLYVNSANITGTIQANQLNLTGAITFGDLDSSVQGDISDAVSIANQALDLAGSISLPPYIQETYIDSVEVRSPTIMGGEIYALSGGDTYATMDGDAFSLMRQSSSRPRAMLYATDNDAILALGAGSDINDQNTGRLFLQKSYLGGDNIGAVLFVKDDGSPMGITMRGNGIMSFTADQIEGLYLTFS